MKQMGIKKSGHHFFVRGLITFVLIGLAIGFQLTSVFAKVGPQGYPGSFAELVDKSSASVVNIIAVKVMRGPAQGATPFGPQDPLRDFFERFFGKAK